MYLLHDIVQKLLDIVVIVAFYGVVRRTLVTALQFYYRT